MMAVSGERLTEREWHQAHRTARAWQQDPDAARACPRCGATGLRIEDRSARPYAEWFHLTCAGCGLAETLHVPLAPNSGGSV